MLYSTFPFERVSVACHNAELHHSFAEVRLLYKFAHCGSYHAPDAVHAVRLNHGEHVVRHEPGPASLQRGQSSQKCNVIISDPSSSGIVSNGSSRRCQVFSTAVSAVAIARHLNSSCQYAGHQPVPRRCVKAPHRPQNPAAQQSPIVREVPDSVTLFAEKGGDPEIVRESQRRRYVNKDYCDEKVALVDKVIDLDKQWREGAEHVPYCIRILRTTAAASSFAVFVQMRAVAAGWILVLASVYTCTWLHKTAHILLSL